MQYVYKYMDVKSRPMVQVKRSKWIRRNDALILWALVNIVFWITVYIKLGQ